MKSKRIPRDQVALAVPGLAPALVNPVMLTEVRELILATRQQVAQTVNAALTMLYWQIGARIRQDILKKKRAEYGQEILPTLSGKLAPEFGNGFLASFPN